MAVWPRSLHARLLSDCLGLVAGGDRRQGGGFGGCWYCVERKRRKQPCLRKRKPVASGLPGGTEVFCWKNRKPGFPGPARPLAGHLPQLPSILIAPASHQLLSCPAPSGPLLCPMLRPPAFRQSCLPKLTAWRQDSPSEGQVPYRTPDAHLSHSCEPDRLSRPLVAIIREQLLRVGSPLRDQPQV